MIAVEFKQKPLLGFKVVWDAFNKKPKKYWTKLFYMLLYASFLRFLPVSPGLATSALVCNQYKGNNARRLNWSKFSFVFSFKAEVIALKHIGRQP